MPIIFITPIYISFFDGMSIRASMVRLSLDSSCYRWILETYRELRDTTEKVVALFLEFQSKKPETTWADEEVEICLILSDSLGKSGRAFEALGYFRETESLQMLQRLLRPPMQRLEREAEIAAGDLFLEATETNWC